MSSAQRYAQLDALLEVYRHGCPSHDVRSARSAYQKLQKDLGKLVLKAADLESRAHAVCLKMQNQSDHAMHLVQTAQGAAAHVLELTEELDARKRHAECQLRLKQDAARAVERTQQLLEISAMEYEDMSCELVRLKEIKVVLESRVSISKTQRSDFDRSLVDAFVRLTTLESEASACDEEMHSLKVHFQIGMIG